MKRRRLAWVPVALLACAQGCADGPSVRQAEDAGARLQSALERAVEGRPVGGVLLVDVPGTLHFTGAAGVSDPASARRMRADDRFRIASISKAFTAAVVLSLAAEGRLDLDGTLAPYFPEALLDRLHVMPVALNGPSRSRGREITLRQLLGHTTGLGDYFFDADENRNGTGDMVELITRDPTRHWQPRELLDYAIAHTRPRLAPGQGFYYSDTNYVILGLVVESVMGRPLHEVYRERLLTRLGLPGTYLQAYEPPTSGPPADVFFYGNDVAPEFEIPGWGGGGLVSNTDELERFARALFEGDAVPPAALAEMRRWSEESRGEYGLGLMRRFSPGAELWGHNGYWDSFMWYWPQRRALICGTLNDSNGQAALLVSEVVRIVNDGGDGR